MTPGRGSMGGSYFPLMCFYHCFDALLFELFFLARGGVVTGSDDKTVKTWDVATQKVTATFAEHTAHGRSRAHHHRDLKDISGRIAKSRSFEFRKSRSFEVSNRESKSCVGGALRTERDSQRTCMALGSMHFFSRCDYLSRWRKRLYRCTCAPLPPVCLNLPPPP